MDISFLQELTNNNTLFIHIMNSFVLIILITLFITARLTGKRWLKINDYLGTITKTINSVRYGDLTKKIEKAVAASTPGSVDFPVLPGFPFLADLPV